VAQNYNAVFASTKLLELICNLKGVSFMIAFSNDEDARSLSSLLALHKPTVDLGELGVDLWHHDLLGTARQARFKSNKASFTAHNLDKEVPFLGFGGISNLVDGFNGCVHGRIIANGIIRTA
jgi:hypothetical protein